MKTVGIVQARMGSTRLPGKVLMDLCGEPVLARVVTRARRAGLPDQIVVATTTLPQDDVIAELCDRRGWPVFRGEAEDVLDRYYRAATAFEAETVVRITSDCPLIDPDVIDRTILALRAALPRADYACTFLPKRTFPLGLDVEAFSFEALERAWREDADPALREHVTEYILRNPRSFALRGVRALRDASHHRWTVDTTEDLELVRRIYEALGRDDFTWHEALRVVESNPWWHEINAHVAQKAAP